MLSKIVMNVKGCQQHKNQGDFLTKISRQFLQNTEKIDSFFLLIELGINFYREASYALEAPKFTVT
jgi:hypothetical protein